MFGLLHPAAPGEYCPRCRQPYDGRLKSFIAFTDPATQTHLTTVYGSECCQKCEYTLLRWPLAKRSTIAAQVGLVGFLHYYTRESRAVRVTPRGVRPAHVSESSAVHLCLVSWGNNTPKGNPRPEKKPLRTSESMFGSVAHQLPSELPRRALRKPSLKRAKP
ncbi:hypothetical protein QKW35_13535 [Pontibacterium granulatum]|uniref:hypothetical protein n=1 Tax=Pontibacterium granulatum TaxID=2036029 RepID=UPI00249B4480|nr:hypothetical protein [Pontibacterium granulatum]MDI3325399.1 hypothetical protein [Pontibacterium granulatum]